MAAMETVSTPSIGGAFAEILQTERARFNALFHAAQMNAPALDGAPFGVHLSTRVAPFVEAIHARDETRSHSAAVALYEISLQLFAKNLLGDAPRSTLIPLAWEKLFPALPQFASKRVFGALCNALTQIENTPGARGEEWIEAMSTLAISCNDGDDFLRVGQVVAWRCGLAQLRKSALETARELSARDEVLARAALGVANPVAPLHEIIARLEIDVWHAPDGVMGTKKIRKVVGAFRGLEKDGKVGAVFLQPPRVSFYNGNFFAADEENLWLFFADSYGAYFQRIGTLGEFSGDARTPSFNGTTNESIELPELAGASSMARGESTLAVTLPHSHAIYLVA
jgi:hypothetical protein